MFDFFFYGTLLDAEVRALVFGRPVPDEALMPAALPEHRRQAVRDQPYPAAVPETGASVDGLVLPDVGVAEAAMLSCFEGAEYEARRCPIAPVAPAAAGGIAPPPTAWVFIAGERVARADAAWSLDDWRARHKTDFVEIAKAWLDGISPADIRAAERSWSERLKP